MKTPGPRQVKGSGLKSLEKVERRDVPTMQYQPVAGVPCSLFHFPSLHTQKLLPLLHLRSDHCFPQGRTYIYIWIYIIYQCICLFVYIFICVSVQVSSVTQSCPTLCNPMNLSTPGLPVHHQLPKSTQTCVH